VIVFNNNNNNNRISDRNDTNENEKKGDTKQSAMIGTNSSNDFECDFSESSSENELNITETKNHSHVESNEQFSLLSKNNNESMRGTVILEEPNIGPSLRPRSINYHFRCSFLFKQIDIQSTFSYSSETNESSSYFSLCFFGTKK
jgi:hypothetical protein